MFCFRSVRVERDFNHSHVIFENRILIIKYIPYKRAFQHLRHDIQEWNRANNKEL